jgi:hypothetical protein
VVVGAEQREVHFNALLDSRAGKAFGHSALVGLIRELLVDLREIVLAVDILNMRQELGPFAQEMHAALEQASGAAHFGGIDLRLRKHAAAEQVGHVVVNSTVDRPWSQYICSLVAATLTSSGSTR